MRGTSWGRGSPSLRSARLLVAAASLCAGCAHYFGDLDERQRRPHSAPSGRPKRLDTERAFAVNDEFDLFVSLRRYSERAVLPSLNEASLIAALPSNLDCVIAGRARVLRVEREALRAISVDVTRADWREGVGALVHPIAVGQRVLVFASVHGAVERVVFDRPASALAMTMAQSCFEYAPVWTSLRAWFGPSSRRRVGEEWRVGEEDHSPGGWRGERTSADRYARLGRVTERDGARAFLLQSWSDGPLLARPVVGRDRWERRRLTSDVSALIVRGVEAPWQRVESVTRAEYVLPTRVVYRGPVSVHVAMGEEFTIDDMTAHRIAELARFSRGGPLFK